MKSVYKWLQNKNRREVLTFVGTGCALVIGALWTAYLHFEKPIVIPRKDEPNMRIEATYKVVMSADRDDTGLGGEGAEWLPCDASLEKWAADKCGNLFRYVKEKTGAGGGCGYAVYSIKCTVNK